MRGRQILVKIRGERVGKNMRKLRDARELHLKRKKERATSESPFYLAWQMETLGGNSVRARDREKKRASLSLSLYVIGSHALAGASRYISRGDIFRILSKA